MVWLTLNPGGSNSAGVSSDKADCWKFDLAFTRVSDPPHKTAGFGRPNLVNVHLTEGQELQYIDLEARALLAVLAAGYVKEIGVSSDSLRTSEELIDAIGRPNE
jgi:hypothetical protein